MYLQEEMCFENNCSASRVYVTFSIFPHANLLVTTDRFLFVVYYDTRKLSFTFVIDIQRVYKVGMVVCMSYQAHCVFGSNVQRGFLAHPHNDTRHFLKTKKARKIE